MFGFDIHAYTCAYNSHYITCKIVNQREFLFCAFNGL